MPTRRGFQALRSVLCRRLCVVWVAGTGKRCFRLDGPREGRRAEEASQGIRRRANPIAQRSVRRRHPRGRAGVGQPGRRDRGVGGHDELAAGRVESVEEDCVGWRRVCSYFVYELRCSFCLDLCVSCENFEWLGW